MKNKSSRLLALLLTLAMVFPMVANCLPVGAESATDSGASSSTVQSPVASAAATWDFASDTQGDDFTFYNSGTSSFSVKDGMLVPSGTNGEMKAIAKSNIQDIKFVSVDIIPGASGLINAGLYVGASNVGNTADSIDALAFFGRVMVFWLERCTKPY